MATKEEVQAAKDKIAEIGREVRSQPKYTGVSYYDTGPRVGTQLNRSIGGGAGTGGAAAELKMLNNPKAIKKGGSVRGHGIEAKGRTKGRML